MTLDSNKVKVMEETSAYRLARLISILGTNATEFAKANNIPKSSLSLYLSGQRKMKQDRIGQISYKYNIDPAWLMGYDVPMEKRDPAATATLHGTLISKFSKLSDRDQEIVMNMIDSMLGSKS